MKLIKSIFLPVVLFVMSGCGSDSSDLPADLDGENEIYLSGYYVEGEGDRLVTEETLSAVYSNGESLDLVTERVMTYLQVDTIPEKYGYSGVIEGPYILETTTINDVLDSYEYSSLESKQIIDDDFEFFESVDFTISQGSNEVEDVKLGESYSYSKNATLFYSDSGIEAGSSVIQMIISISNLENIEVPAGNFNSVKISYTAVFENTTETRTSHSDVFGDLWIDVDKGHLLKATVSGDLSFSWTEVTAEMSAVTILKSLDIASNSAEERRGRKLKIDALDAMPSLSLVASEVVTIISTQL